MREMFVRSHYIVLYRESPERVEIVNVIHARRQWPSISQPDALG
jgi:plasmid stabilization system protein ParE